MKTTLTITSKGQTTLPITIRKKLGIPQDGGTLHIAFDEDKGEAVITKPLGIEDLSKQISRHIKPGTKPLLNVDDYYQMHREKK